LSLFHFPVVGQAVTESCGYCLQHFNKKSYHPESNCFKKHPEKHQGFFTKEAMEKIARTTLENISNLEKNLPLATSNSIV
jgi:hypothetical protein